MICAVGYLIFDYLISICNQATKNNQHHNGHLVSILLIALCVSNLLELMFQIEF